MGGMYSRQIVATSLDGQPERKRPCAVPRIPLKCIMRVGTVVTVLRTGSSGSRLLSTYNMANVLNMQLSVCPYVFCPVASASQSGDCQTFASA